MTGTVTTQKVCKIGTLWYGYWYIYLLQLDCHPVAVVQRTFTHKQYTERHKTNNT